jgi:hypothetical protein
MDFMDPIVASKANNHIQAGCTYKKISITMLWGIDEERYEHLKRSVVRPEPQVVHLEDTSCSG